MLKGENIKMAGHNFNPDKAFVLDNPIRKLMLSLKLLIGGVKK